MYEYYSKLIWLSFAYVPLSRHGFNLHTCSKLVE